MSQLGWGRYGHGLSSCPRESCDHQFLAPLLNFFGYPDGAATELFNGTLKLRYSSTLFSKKFPSWPVSTVSGHSPVVGSGPGPSVTYHCGSCHSPWSSWFFWDSTWCTLYPIPITREDVAVWPYSVNILLEFSSFLASLHWPQGDTDLGKFGVSYFELLLMFEIYVGHRLYAEKAVRSHLRPRRPLCFLGFQLV